MATSITHLALPLEAEKRPACGLSLQLRLELIMAKSNLQANA
jgi:hypothetical protein